MTEKKPLAIGDVAPDGSVFAGTTPDGRSQVFAMSADLGVTMTFNDAARAVETLNTSKMLGHDDWQLPSLETLRVLYKNQNEGALKGPFNTSGNKGSGSGYPDLYWSSTENRDCPSYVHDVRFSDGLQYWHLKDYNRLSCRPVRVVAVPAPPKT